MATATASVAEAVPLLPASITHVCVVGLEAIVTLYDRPDATSGSKRNAPFFDTVSFASTPSASSRSTTPSAPSHRPRTLPATGAVGSSCLCAATSPQLLSSIASPHPPGRNLIILMDDVYQRAVAQDNLLSCCLLRSAASARW